VIQSKCFKMKKGIVVCFIGIDGSGKTSHAKSLSTNLAISGLASFRIRPEYLLSNCLPHSLMNWISTNILSSSKMKIVERWHQKDARTRGSVRSHIFKALMNAGLLFYAWFMHELVVKVRLSRYSMIYDRYFYDWIFYLNGNRFDSLVRIVPKADLVFLLDLEVPEAFSRMHWKKDKEFPSEYYSSLRNWYLTLARYYGFVIVDCARHFDETSFAILDNTLRLLKG
jgi:thymidylate kinase